MENKREGDKREEEGEGGGRRGKRKREYKGRRANVEVEGE